MGGKIKRALWVFFQIILAFIVFYLAFCITSAYRLERAVEAISIEMEAIE